MSSDVGEDSVTTVQRLAMQADGTSNSNPATVDLCSVKSSVSSGAAVVTRSSSLASSPVSDLAQNLEILSTDGFVSQGSSLSTDG